MILISVFVLLVSTYIIVYLVWHRDEVLSYLEIFCEVFVRVKICYKVFRCEFLMNCCFFILGIFEIDINMIPIPVTIIHVYCSVFDLASRTWVFEVEKFEKRTRSKIYRK